MVTATLQKEEFQDRLQRIARGGPNTLGQLMAGPAEDNRTREKSSRKPRKAARAEARMQARQQAQRQARSRRSTNPIGAAIGGVLIGAMAVLVVRYVRFRLTGEALGGANADFLLAIDLVLAMTLAIMFRTIFGSSSRLHGVGKLLGVGAMALAMHNLVFFAPGVFSQVFSTQWVQSVTATTEPNSLLLAGTEFLTSAPGQAVGGS